MDANLIQYDRLGKILNWGLGNLGSNPIFDTN